MGPSIIACARAVVLDPPDVRQRLPDNHLAWFVLAAVEEMDLWPFYAAYRVGGGAVRLTSGRRRPSARPRRAQGRWRPPAGRGPAARASARSCASRSSRWAEQRERATHRRSTSVARE